MKQIMTIIIALFMTSALYAVDINENISIYGFARFDVIYNTTDLNQGIFALWANHDTATYTNRRNVTYSENSNFIMSPAFSRLGIDIKNYKVPETSLTMGAKIEFDFMGGYKNQTGAFQPLLSLRHAYGELKSDSWSLLIGQTFTLGSTPFPNSANVNLSLGHGNPWIRLPQIRFTYNMKPFSFAVSANRMVSNDATFYGTPPSSYMGSEPLSDGEFSPIPLMMGEISAKTELISAGLVGHYGKTKAWKKAQSEEEDFNSLLGMAYVGIKTKKVAATVKGFYAQDANYVFCGIGQGIFENKNKNNELFQVKSIGGFANLDYNFYKSWTLTAGASLEKVTNDDELNDNMRTNNMYIWGNVSYKLGNKWNFILEGGYLETKYMNEDIYKTGKNPKVHFQSQFNF